MYRKIMNYLEEWKKSKHRKPLILQGARQVERVRECFQSDQPMPAALYDAAMLRYRQYLV